MIYFDTDFWVNFYIDQNIEKQEITKEILFDRNTNGKVFASLLNVQEIAFVFGKLNYTSFETEKVINDFYKLNPLNYTTSHFKRAINLAKIIGFKNINDCIHTAIAEDNCSELYTFNRRDFEKIKKHTKLKINIL